MTAPLTGYADRISVRAGEKISFKVSSVGPGPYNAMLVRIVRGDPNPGGPAQKLEDESELFDGRFASRQQHAWPGSYALIERAADVKLPGALVVEALIWPTLPEDGPQTVISRRDAAHLRRGLRAGADARRHGAGMRQRARRRGQEAAQSRLVSRLGLGRSRDRHDAGGAAAPEARFRCRRRGRGEHDS